MRAWLLPRRWPILSVTTRTLHGVRSIHSNHRVETVTVPCASSGSIKIDLFNLSEHTANTPLLLYLTTPADTGSSSSSPLLPSFLGRYPTVKINYRWSPVPDKHLSSPSSAERTTLPQWPTPIHDTLFAYSWVVEHLRPPADSARRDVYVYGSHLGAGLAAALALTESHPHQPMAIRGLLAHNGIYNWTTFLPDHSTHKARRQRQSATVPGEQYPAEHEQQQQQQQQPSWSYRALERQIPQLFPSPADLFDPFASPCLFFHTSGMLVPEEFDAAAGSSPSSAISPSLAQAIDALSQDPLSSLSAAVKAPRKGYLAFPPRQSSLRIPQTLLLHDTPDAAPVAAAQPGTPGRKARGSGPRGRKKQHQAEGDSFRAQADQLALLMRRSVEKLELKARSEWEDWDADDGRDLDGRRAMEAQQRVAVVDVGEAGGENEGLSTKGEELAGRWLEETIRLRL